MRDLYQDFMQLRAQDGCRTGFNPVWMPSCLFDFQESVTEWNLWSGKSATLADCGLGKTLMELVWGENVVRHTNKPVLDLTPLAVAGQTVSEAAKFDIEINRCNDGKPQGKCVQVTNYEKLHHFNPNDYGGVICDESSCLKGDGPRRAAATEFMRTVPYRLMATATPAPNDYIELGTTSEALGVMGQMDMLNRFFKNDDGNSLSIRRPGRFTDLNALRNGTGNKWRFKGHAAQPFYRWVCGWARAGRKPSDFGPFSDKRFVLPKLIEREHIVETRTLADGYLYPLPASNRREELDERRRTIQERCEKAAELVANTGKPFVIWCHLNPEGDLLEKLIPDAIQISGADSDEAKEEKWSEFIGGKVRGMISKQKIGGWGLNLQFCAHVVEFASHSFEAHYQGVRRCWRFGQTEDVINDIIATEGEKGAKDNMQRKSAAADQLFSMLVEHMHEALRIDNSRFANQEVIAPAWL